MAGTVEGGKAAAATNKQKYGSDFYGRIGAMGGKKGHTGGFAADIVCRRACPLQPTHHYIRNCAGYKGGVKSRRTKVAA